MTPNQEKYVYIAGPYSSAPLENTHKAIDLAVELIDAGYKPFVPHLTHYIHQRHPRDYEKWMEYDFSWLEKCSALIRLPGYSDGADREVARAKELKIPVYYGIADFLNG